jgi:hypothetical protein
VLGVQLVESHRHELVLFVSIEAHSVPLEVTVCCHSAVQASPHDQKCECSDAGDVGIMTAPVSHARDKSVVSRKPTKGRIAARAAFVCVFRPSGLLPSQPNGRLPVKSRKTVARKRSSAEGTRDISVAWVAEKPVPT